MFVFWPTPPSECLIQYFCVSVPSLLNPSILAFPLSQPSYHLFFFPNPNTSCWLTAINFLLFASTLLGFGFRPINLDESVAVCCSFVPIFDIWPPMHWNQHFSILVLHFFPVTTFLFASIHLSKDQVVQLIGLFPFFCFPAAQTKIIFLVLDFSLYQLVLFFSFWVQHLADCFSSWIIPDFIAATSAFQLAVVPNFVFSSSKYWLIFIWVDNYSAKYFSILEMLTEGFLFP